MKIKACCWTTVKYLLLNILLAMFSDKNTSVISIYVSFIFRFRILVNTAACLWLVISANAASKQVWRCSGPETEYTARDCELDRKKMVSDDCYFLQHFQQYRSCSAICNDVVCDSIDEDRCRAYCPGMK